MSVNDVRKLPSLTFPETPTGRSTTELLPISSVASSRSTYESFSSSDVSQTPNTPSSTAVVACTNSVNEY